VGSDGPFKLLPQIPAISQTLPGYTAKAWWGIFAPAGTPPDIVNKVNQAFKRALSEPGIEDLFVANAVVQMTTTPAELGRIVSKGLADTKALVTKYQIPPE
jgi:tripartite-type tricarboxylate transporter receptor subunit TctC